MSKPKVNKFRGRLLEILSSDQFEGATLQGQVDIIDDYFLQLLRLKLTTATSINKLLAAWAASVVFLFGKTILVAIPVYFVWTYRVLDYVPPFYRDLLEVGYFDFVLFLFIISFIYKSLK